MIKDTNQKFNGPQNRLQRVKKSGFIQLIVIIIIAVALMMYFKINPKVAWTNLIKPIIEWGFDIFVKIIGFIFDIVIWLLNRLRAILNI